jgi:hypothetical protein
MANLENNNVSSISNNEIRLYPNPASSDVILQTETPLNSAILTVKNYLGQTVIEMINLNGQTVVLNRDNLVSGLYFIYLTEENKTIAVDKLIITDI